MLPEKGGDTMITYDALSAFCTLGLLIVAVITLFKDKR